jgi:hypothetical protein
MGDPPQKCTSYTIHKVIFRYNKYTWWLWFIPIVTAIDFEYYIGPEMDFDLIYADLYRYYDQSTYKKIRITYPNSGSTLYKDLVDIKYIQEFRDREIYIVYFE